MAQTVSHALEHWLDANPDGCSHCIMLPWNSIERLRDHFGDYLIVVTCRHCKHSRELTPAFLARHCRAGWDEPVAKIIARFRCRCGKKLVDVHIGFNRKPRGWVKNPS
jgi:hypothetical protein